jgi:hypothetical protein
MPDVPVKYPYVGGTRWAFWKWADIPDARDESRVYLRRLRILQTPYFALYLHFIYQSDKDRDPHDHPFAFRSLIVRGGYTERVWRTYAGHVGGDGVERTWRRWSLHKTPLNVAHMIDYLWPNTVTLVFCGPKVKDWGFYTEQGFTPWQRYNRDKYASEPF